MKKKRWWRDEEEENVDVNGCSDEWADVSRYRLKTKTLKNLSIVIFNISEAPLLSGLSGNNLVTSQNGEQINSGIREILAKLCVIVETFLSTNLLLSFFRRCRLAGYQLLQSASILRVLAYSFVPRFPLPLLTKGDWNPWRRWQLEWGHHMFSTNQFFVSYLKTELYEKPFTIWTCIAGTTLVTRLNP